MAVTENIINFAKQNILQIAITQLNTKRDSRLSRESERDVGSLFYHYNGRNKGLKRGREEGRAEGRTEEKLSNARTFKSLGVSLETIAKATGLTIEEIQKL